MTPSISARTLRSGTQRFGGWLSVLLLLCTCGALFSTTLLMRQDCCTEITAQTVRATARSSEPPITGAIRGGINQQSTSAVCSSRNAWTPAE